MAYDEDNGLPVAILSPIHRQAGQSLLNQGLLILHRVEHEGTIALFLILTKPGLQNLPPRLYFVPPLTNAV